MDGPLTNPPYRFRQVGLEDKTPVTNGEDRERLLTGCFSDQLREIFFLVVSGWQFGFEYIGNSTF
jgi:hypothetical protein